MTRNQRLKTFHKRSIREEDSDESDNELDSSSNYKIEFKPLSLEEKEEKEEQQLLSLINQLKNNPKLNSSNEDSYDEDGFKSSYSKKINNISISTVPDDIEIDEYFINQNLTLYNKILKLSLIGDKKNVISLFINKLISNQKLNSNNNELSLDYLEIHKTLLQINDKKIKLELFNIPSSEMESEIMKTYFQISNGFIFVIDINTISKEENLVTLKEKIQKIINSKPGVFLIINNSMNENIEKLKNFWKNEKNYFFLNFNDFTLDNFTFNKFLITLLNKKDEPINKIL